MASELDKLLSTIEEQEKKLSAPGFDMNQYLLPDSEVVKNLITIRNPNMSKGDINLMVDGLGGGGEQSEIISNLDKLANEGDTPFKKKLINDTVADSKNNLDKIGIPISKSDDLYEESKDLKKTMVEKSSEFVRKIQELIKDIAFATITLSQAIPGAISLIITPILPIPSFNIPGMVTMIMNIILTLNTIKSKCADIKGTFIYFSKLKVVCSEQSANTVAGVLNGMNTILDTTICGFADKIDAFTLSAISAMKSSLDPAEEGKKIKNITTQLRKMDYLPNDNFNDVDEDDVDGVNNILTEWEVINRTHRTSAVRRKKESKDALDNVLSSIEKLDNLNNELKELTTIKEPVSKVDEIIVYDVEFPDGKIVKGLTKDEVDGYAATYNVIYSPNVKFIDNPLPTKFSLKSAQRTSVSSL